MSFLSPLEGASYSLARHRPKMNLFCCCLTVLYSSIIQLQPDDVSYFIVRLKRCEIEHDKM